MSDVVIERYRASDLIAGGWLTRGKFGWMAGIDAEPGLTMSEKYVLTRIPERWITGPDGTTFGVKQTTIADRLDCTERHVRTTQSKARTLGWLNLFTERPRGHANRADWYELTVPVWYAQRHLNPDREVPDNLAGTEVPEHRAGTGVPERDAQVPERDAQVPERDAQVPERANAVTSEKGKGQGLSLQGFISSGFNQQGVTLSSATAPAPKDDTHPPEDEILDAVETIILRALHRHGPLSRSRLRTHVALGPKRREETNRLRRAIPAALDRLTDYGCITEHAVYTSEHATRPQTVYSITAEYADYVERAS